VAGQGVLAVGFDHRTSRDGDPLLHTHLVVANRSRVRTAAGPPWTDGTCTGIGWPQIPSTEPPTSTSSSGHSGWSGHRRTSTVTGSWPDAGGVGAGVLQAD
jgi:hypothetical protein